MGACQSMKSNSNNNNISEEYSNLGVCYKVPQNYRRERINSDPQRNYPTLAKLQPLRRHSRYNADSSNNIITFNNNNNIINFNNNNNNPINRNNIIDISNRNLRRTMPQNNTSNNSFTSRRKTSRDYCTEFRNSYMTSGQNCLLRHLAESVQRVQEYTEEELEQLKKKLIPEYIIDWRLETDPLNKISFWKNCGKIPINDPRVKNILFPKNNMIKPLITSSDEFYKKRLWLCQYIFKNFKSQTNENPILVINRANILEDSYQQFMTTKGFNLRMPIRIFFID